MRRITDFILIFISLLFSQFIIMNFNLHHGFEYQGIKIQLLPVVAFRGSSLSTTISSNIIGYILFLIFLLSHYKNEKARISKIYDFTLLATLLIVFYELRSIYLEVFNIYKGEKLFVGIVLFFLNLQIFKTIYRKPLNNNITGKRNYDKNAIDENS